MTGEQRQLSVGNALQWGWQTAIENPKVTIFYVLMYYALQWAYTLHLIFDILPDLHEGTMLSSGVQFGLLIVALCVAYFYIFQSLSIIALKIARGQSIANEKFYYVPTLKEYSKIFLFMVMFLLIFVLLIVLIIPGILFGLRYSQAYWIFLEKEGRFSFNFKRYLSVMKKSAEITKGFRATIFGIYFATALMFGIGGKILANTDNIALLVAADIVKNFSYVFDAFVMAYVYVQLNPNREELVENTYTVCN
jgi:hypothetical protein